MKRSALRPGRLARGLAVLAAVLVATAASASPPGATPRRMLRGGIILCALNQVDCSFTASYGNKELTVEDKTKPSPPPQPPRPAGPAPAGQQALLQQQQQRAQPIVININNFNGAEGQAASVTTARPGVAAGVPPLPPPAANVTANVNATAAAAAARPAAGVAVPGGTITNSNGAVSG